jgi:hypothetical protein
MPENTGVIEIEMGALVRRDFRAELDKVKTRRRPGLLGRTQRMALQQLRSSGAPRRAGDNT